MSNSRITLALASLALLATTALAGPGTTDIQFIITTDSDVNDNGGLDEFAPIPTDGSTQTVYIWGAADTGSISLFEFNFDLENSGSGLSFSNATIGPFFNDVAGSLGDTNLNDLQFGWSAFFVAPPSVTTPPYVLFGTVDVTIAPGTTPGPDTTIHLDGSDYTLIDAATNDLIGEPRSRDLAGDPPCTIDEDCDDGVFCNGAETCDAGTCEPGTPPTCNDDVGCTIDSCNTTTDSCDNIPDNGNCDNGQFCDGSETCDLLLDCQPGTPPNCNDGIACTNDSCNETDDSCDNVTNDSLCDNGMFCDGVETCNAVMGCMDGTPVNCNDNVGCTTDSCNEATDTCDHSPDNATCDNGEFCDGQEICSLTLDCQPGMPPDCDDNVGCTTDSCNEITDTCDHSPDNAACNNGLFCDGQEICSLTLDCQPGTPPDCNDNVGCTTDGCNEATDTCDHTPDNGACNNGQFCDGQEICSLTLDCQPGTPTNCDDGVLCTMDSCNEDTDSCDNLPNSGMCNNGQFCDGIEICDPTDGCSPGPDPCPGQMCIEVSNTCVDCLFDFDCSNGVFCDGTEVCNAGVCEPGTPPSCDDAIPCTTDSCNTSSDSCENAPDNNACDNGQFCDGAEVCVAGIGCQSGIEPCNDNVNCTNDSCNETSDSCNNVPNDGNCDNGVFCDGTETCDPAQDCLPGTPVDCNDNVDCTDDSCNETNGSCDNVPDNTNCDNGQFCDGAETCDPMLDCQPGTPPDCSDAVGCTDDLCNETTDSCDNTPNDGNCNNGLFCDGTETCHPTLDCLPGNSPDCDDNVGCTDDSCNEATDSCDNTPDDANCDNGTFCDGAETCDPVNDCMPGSDPCPDGICLEADELCVDCMVDADCDNGQFCDGTETCNAGVCQAGTPPDCSDGINCTNDSCNESTDSCENAPDDALCDNGMFCDGTEACNIVIGCVNGAPPDCIDSIDCTNDSCNEGTDSCDNVPDNGFCDNGVFCDGPETCDPLAGCMSATPVDCDDNVACTLDSCNEASGSCLNEPANVMCDNGMFCDGAETCDLVLDCQPGTPPDCSDGVDCTDDTCNESTDSCDNAPNNDNCDNGQFCDGSETCDPMLDCQPGTPPDCSDAVACTDDSCNEASDSCENVANDDNCDNGLYCDGAEACDENLGCQAGQVPDCDDGVSCTVDSCNESSDQCDHLATNDLCDNGTFCDGMETCHPTLDCRTGNEPCLNQICLEDQQLCVECFVDEDCDDGNICTTDICESISCTNTLIQGCVQEDLGDPTLKGSILVFPAVELQWDPNGTLIQDTILSITNDFTADIQVTLKFVNGDDDLEELNVGSPPVTVEREHPGWNTNNRTLTLTANESRGISLFNDTEFLSLDPASAGPGGDGRPNTETAEPNDRYLRGFVIAWAVDNAGHQVSWNHLYGKATTLRYDQLSSWEYPAVAFAALSRVEGATIGNTEGVLILDGIDYARCPDRLLLDFYASGSSPFPVDSVSPLLETDLSLLPMIQDLRDDGDGPLHTKAHFDIWDENEDFYSGTHRCIWCWDQFLLVNTAPIANAFPSLATNKGKARIDGVASPAVCDDQFCCARTSRTCREDYEQDNPGLEAPICSEDAPLIGVAVKILSFENSAIAYAGSPLRGQSLQEGYIKADLPSQPEPARTEEGRKSLQPN